MRESNTEVTTFYLFQIYAFLYSFTEGEILFELSIIFARCDKQFFISAPFFHFLLPRLFKDRQITSPSYLSLALCGTAAVLGAHTNTRSFSMVQLFCWLHQHLQLCTSAVCGRTFPGHYTWLSPFRVCRIHLPDFWVHECLMHCCWLHNSHRLSQGWAQCL